MSKAWPLYAGSVAMIIVVGMVLGLWRDERRASMQQGASAGSIRANRAAPAVSPDKDTAATPAPRPEKGPEIAAEARALMNRASAVVGTDPNKASTLLHQALQLDPTNTPVYFQLGLVYVKQKNYSKAAEIYRKIAEMQPDLPEAYFNLGYAYAMSGDYATAEEMYLRVVQLSPSYLDEAFFNLGMVQQKQGKKDEAAANFERALSANPNNETALKELNKLRGKTAEAK